MPIKAIRVFEAFAGYGSQHLALCRLASDFPDFSFEVVGISEIEKNAIAAYSMIHGDCPNYGDISKIDWAQVPDFDLFTYSFPCQDISNAGLQRGFSEDTGTRSSLLWECRKAIEAKHPKWLLMENVKALIQKKFKPDFDRWLRLLGSMGYANFYQVMDAKDYGVPQHRERVFMVSILRTADAPNPHYCFPRPFLLERRLKHVLQPYGTVPEEYYLPDEKVAKILAHCDRKVAEGCGLKTDAHANEGLFADTDVGFTQAVSK